MTSSRYRRLADLAAALLKQDNAKLDKTELLSLLDTAFKGVTFGRDTGNLGLEPPVYLDEKKQKIELTDLGRQVIRYSQPPMGPNSHAMDKLH